jgi:hypothetical protein
MRIQNLKTIIIVFIMLLMFLGGCSSKTEELYQDSIQKGLDAVAENNFSKAEGLFEVALDTKKSDVKTKAYLNQIKLIIKADDLVKQNKIEDAIQSLEKSIKVKEGSKVIASASKDKKETLLKFQENQKNYNTLLTDAKNLNHSGEYQKSNEKLDELLKADLTQFATIQDEAKKLKDSNNEAIKNAQIAQAQKDAQAKVAAAEQAAKKDTPSNTLSTDNVMIHYSINNNGDLELLYESIVLKKGQRLVLKRDDQNKIIDRILYDSVGVIDSFDNSDGFIAIAPGTTKITIIPDEDWDKSKEIKVTVIN